MADISNEIKNFREAIYGREVRGSMISLAEKMNGVSEITERAEEKRVSAETNRVNAEKKRQTDTEEAIRNSTAATNRAEEAAERAEGLVIGDISEKTVTFVQAAERSGIQSGDSLAIAFGKLAKYCADLKPHAFEEPVQNLITTVAGKALDATMGKQINDDLSAKVRELNSALEGKQDTLYGGSKTNGENIDNIFINTVVWINTKSSGSLPNSDYNLLLCINNNTNTVQIAFPFSGGNPVKWRMHVNSSWQAWRAI